ncbi:MAG: hypothetical protein H7831_14170 [Magnetococcus sp. WYHC-3]
MDNVLMFLSGVVAMILVLIAYALLSDIINRNKVNEQAKFNLNLIRFWEQAHQDAKERNDHLESIACALEGMERKNF